jgi:NTE family protein
VTAVVELLRESPLFAHLDDHALAALAARCTTRRYDKGATVCTIGDPADELFIVAEGAVAVWGVGEVVAHLSRPATVGEVALLLREPRSATITTTRPTEVVLLGAEDFDELVRDDVNTIAAIGKMLAHRLRATTHRARSRHSLIIATLGEPGQRGVTLVARFLEARLTRDLSGPVVRLTVGADGVAIDDATVAFREGEVPVRHRQSRADAVADIARRVDQLSARCSAIVVEVSTRSGLDAEAAGSFADVVVELGRNASPPHGLGSNTQWLRVRNHADGSGANHSAASARSFSVPYDASITDRPTLDAARILLDDVRRPTTRALDRLVRAVEGRVVGVALGAGAALGLAHIGALRELEEKGVPIDVIAGSSMGGVVAAGHATGCSARELETFAISQSSFLRLLGTVDPAVTGDGLLAGNQLLRYLRPFLNRARSFSELVVPARLVATDLIAGERVAIGDGDLESAVRATVAMPPFITPLVRDGRTLVDGGIIDPLPVDVVRELGADIVIAISAIPRFHSNAETVLTRASRALNRVNPLAYLTRRSRSLNLLDVVMSSFHIVEHQLGEYMARDADVFIQPDLASHTWIEFYRAPEIIERGAGAARAAAAEIDVAMTSRLTRTFPDLAVSIHDSSGLRIPTEPRPI